MAIQDEYTRITLRLPQDLHELLGKSAEETSKSMNAEIIGRLWETFQKRDLVRHKFGLPMTEPDDETEEFYEAADPAGEPPEELARIGGRLTKYSDQRIATIIANVIKKLEEDEG